MKMEGPHGGEKKWIKSGEKRTKRPRKKVRFDMEMDSRAGGGGGLSTEEWRQIRIDFGRWWICETGFSIWIVR